MNGEPIVPPIVHSATYRFASTADLIDAVNHRAGYVYSRWDNPTVREVEQHLAAIEETDAALPALLRREPDVLCVTGDHSTPIANKAHSWHPVPVMVRSKLCGADRLERFTERHCNSGSLGIFPMAELMPVLLANAGRIDKFGA